MKRLSLIAIISLLSVGLWVPVGSPAHATIVKIGTWTLQDNMETTAALWTDDSDGPSYCPKYTTCDVGTVLKDPEEARSGSYAIRIWSNEATGGWVSIGRSVRIPVTAISCTARLYVRGQLDYSIPAGFNLALDVIRTSNWTYLTQAVTPGTTFAQYQPIRTASFTPPPERDVFVRLVLPGGPFIPPFYADDLAVTCAVLLP